MLIAGIILVALGLIYFIFSDVSSFGMILLALGIILFFIGFNRRDLPKESRKNNKLGIRACYNINPNEFRKLPPEMTVLAIETTGIDLRNNDIIEISLCKAEGESLTECFTSYVKSTVAVPGSVVTATGITNEMIAGAPTFEELVEEIIPWIRETTILCYDLSFCIYFLSRNVGRTDERLMSVYAFDVQTLAQALVPADQIDNYFLPTVMEYFGLDFLPETAENRCRNLFKLYQKLLPLAEEKWPDTGRDD